MITRLMSALGYEKRATTYPHNPAYFAGNWGKGFITGSTPNGESVLSNSAVAARCIALRSQLLASVPLKLYQRLPDGDRVQVEDSPLAYALAIDANPLMSSYEMREFLIRQLDLTGNAYARLVRDSSGQVREIWPVASALVSVEQLESGRLRYRVAGHNRMDPATLIQEEMLHVRASTEDGLLGRSPIEVVRGVLARTVAENQTAQSFAQNGLRFPFALSHPKKLSDTAIKNLQDSIMDLHSGPARVGRPMVLEEDMKPVNLSVNPADAEFLNSRLLSNEDTARSFDVPSGAVGIRDSVSYGSAAADAAALVQNCLQPLASRFEQALMRCCLTPTARRSFVIDHDLKGLLRGNIAERFAAYRIGREVGMYSVNDLRRMEGERMISDGDTYLQPAT
ncbi:MAG: phage portal protein, partial [Pseudomonadota bacterium]